jgi:hypothetical protein
MAVYTTEIGASTGQGPTVRDMYRVLTEIQKADSVEGVRVRVAAIHTNGHWSKRRKFIPSLRELEHHAENGEEDYLPLDKDGIAHYSRDRGDLFDITRSEFERLTPEDRNGSVIRFHVHLLSGEITCHDDVALGRKLGGLAETITGGTGALVIPAYGWMRAVQTAVTDPSAYVTVPYAIMIGGAIFGLGMVADGIRRFGSSERRYLRLTVQTLQDDKKTLTRAERLISVVKK